MSVLTMVSHMLQTGSFDLQWQHMHHVHVIRLDQHDLHDSWPQQLLTSCSSSVIITKSRERKELW